jgi:hypothetical protein
MSCVSAISRLLGGDDVVRLLGVVGLAGVVDALEDDEVLHAALDERYVGAPILSVAPPNASLRTIGGSDRAP